MCCVVESGLPESSDFFIIGDCEGMNKKSDHFKAIRPCLEITALCCVFNLISLISPGQSYVPEKTIAKIVVKPVVEMKAFACMLQ